MAGYYGFNLDVRVSDHPSVVRPSVLLSLPGDNLININGFSPNLVCTLILWRSGLGLLMGKFCQIFTELSASDTIMEEYYSLTFLLISKVKGFCKIFLLKKYAFCGIILRKYKDLML